MRHGSRVVDLGTEIIKNRPHGLDDVLDECNPFGRSLRFARKLEPGLEDSRGQVYDSIQDDLETGSHARIWVTALDSCESPVETAITV
jgi:hypothetical protein